MMHMSPTGLKLLKDFEGCRLTAYQDIVGVWTIGYGFTAGVKEGDTMTQAQCDERLVREIRAYESAVWEAVTGGATQAEFDSLVSFAWNVGIAGMQKSSVIKAHNRNDKQAAARAYGLWNKAGGKAIAGLTRRRAAEAALYLTAAEEPMPQAVDAPKPVESSTTVIAAGTAAVATATQIAESFSRLKESVSGLEAWMPVVSIVALAAIGYVIYERYRNRDRGAI